VLVNENTRGVSAESFKLNKDQADGKLVLNAEKNAPPGERKLNVEARLKFNGQDLRQKAEFTVVVNEKKEETK
jgi:hypothetical protein